MNISQDTLNRLANLLSQGCAVEILNLITGVAKVVPISTAGAGTYTAAQLVPPVGGLIERDCAGANRTDTTDTAANIMAQLKNPQIGDTIWANVINISGAANTITLAGGTNVTLKGSTTAIAQNKTATLIFTITSATAITCYVSVSG